MSTKQEKEEEVELPCMNGDVGRDDDNSGVEEGGGGGGGGGEGEFAAAMAQLALHERVEAEWGAVLQSACQTAAARTLWGRVVRDPAAGVLAGERYLRGLHDKMRRDERAGAREVHGVSARGFARVKLCRRGINFSTPKRLGVNIMSC